MVAPQLLRVSAQVEQSMGGGSAAPCFAEAWEVSGAVLRGLYDGLGCPKCAQCMRQTIKSWLDGAVEGRWMLSRTKHGGANATPCLAEERYCASGTVWRGLYDGLGCPECVQCMPKTAQVIAETAGWCMPEPQCFKFHGWNEAWRELMLLHASWKDC